MNTTFWLENLKKKKKKDPLVKSMDRWQINVQKEFQGYGRDQGKSNVEPLLSR
jgi:hypothetical protein